MTIGGLLIGAARRFDEYRFKRSVSPETVVKTEFGMKMRIHPDDLAVSRRIWRTGNLNPDLTDFFKSEISDGMDVVDIGAQIGYFTLLFADEVGESGTVAAFEAAPENYDILQTNIDINGMENRVVATQKALSDTTGTVDLILKGTNKGGHSTVQQKIDDSDVVGKTRVHTEALDDCLSTKPDIVKIDVEGAEDKVLAGMHSTIETAFPLLVVEFNPDEWQATPKSVLDPIVSNGYSIHELESGGRYSEVPVKEIQRVATGDDLVLKPPN